MAEQRRQAAYPDPDEQRHNRGTPEPGCEKQGWPQGELGLQRDQESDADASQPGIATKEQQPASRERQEAHVELTEAQRRPEWLPDDHEQPPPPSVLGSSFIRHS